MSYTACLTDTWRHGRVPENHGKVITPVAHRRSVAHWQDYQTDVYGGRRRMYRR